MSNGSSIDKDNNDDSDNSQDDYFIRVQQNSGVKDTNQQADYSINLSSDFLSLPQDNISTPKIYSAGLQYEEINMKLSKGIQDRMSKR